MKIFLIGYMACGKSRAGRMLAATSGKHFIDLDKYIEIRERRSVHEIFRDDGEDRFRKLESAYLREVCSLNSDFVMSCGGGTPCFNSNMEYMNSEGITVFLNTSADVIVERLARRRHRRPLVEKLSDEELRVYVQKHLSERMPYYVKAHITLESAEMLTAENLKL